MRVSVHIDNLTQQVSPLYVDGVCVPFPLPLEIERTIILPGTLTLDAAVVSWKEVNRGE